MLRINKVERQSKKKAHTHTHTHTHPPLCFSNEPALFAEAELTLLLDHGMRHCVCALTPLGQENVGSRACVYMCTHQICSV